MRKILLIFATLLGLFGSKASAAIFEATPVPLQQSSTDVVITFNADECNVAALKGLSTDLYAHIGVYTTKSPQSWSHVKTGWSENISANLFKRVGTNKYQLTVGNLRSYFGITDASEKITKICIIARTAAGDAQTADNFIEVQEDGFAAAIVASPSVLVVMQNTSIKYTFYSSENADLKLYVDGKVVKEASGTKKIEYTLNINQVGHEYDIKGTANNGKQTISRETSMFYASEAKKANYPGGTPKQGAVRNSDGTVTFCLAAPNKKNVILVGSWDDYKVKAKNAMAYQDYNGYRYFWVTVSGLKDNTYYPYYYIVDGKYSVGDPYAHLVLDYNSDKWLGNKGVDPWPDRPQYPYDKVDGTMLAVYKSNLDDYKWRVKDFAATKPVAYTNRDAMVVYEMLFRDFTGESKTSDGTVLAAAEKIEYLHKLGVTAIELMPIMQFDGNESWGYNTNFYMAPDKSYGSPDDYKYFIDLCHQYGMAVILDIAFNHTPGLHPWYAMYDKGTSPFYNAECPHQYGVFEDIKQEYPLVEQHWIDVLTYWMTVYKVDGFRFDLVKGLGDSNSYGSNKDTEKYNQTRIDRMKRIHAAMKKVNPNVIHINEHLASAGEETPMGQDGQLLWNNQSGNGAEYMRCKGADLSYFNAVACSRPAGSTVDYAESHDEQRMGYWGRTESDKTVSGSVGGRCKRLGTLAAQLLMNTGPKMIWMFQELGFEENNKNSDGGNNVDPKEVHWEYLNNAERSALYENFCALNDLRRCNPEMFASNATCVLNGFGKDLNPRSIRLTKGNKEILVFINPNTASTGVTVAATVLNASNSRLVTESRNAKTKLAVSGKNVTVTLPAHSFAVYATNQVAGIEEILADEVENESAVFVVNGEIQIAGEYSQAAVYSLDGRTVAAGSHLAPVAVTPGIYIVNVDGVTTKLLVK